MDWNEWPLDVVRGHVFTLNKFKKKTAPKILLHVRRLFFYEVFQTEGSLSVRALLENSENKA